MSVASKSNSQAEALPVAVPAIAPRVRLVSNQPKASRAEWTLTEPVTIIGWGGSSNLRLDDKAMSKMQCLVVNTGREVLLRDLHSPNPTLLNDEPATFAVISEGDRIGVGATTLTVHIESVPPGQAGQQHDPLKLPGRLALEDTVSPEKAVVEKAVTLLGRRKNLDIHLDDAEISPVHAVIFASGQRPVFLDLGSRKGSTVNHQPQQQCPLNEGDLLCMGPFEVRVRLGGWPKPVAGPACSRKPAAATDGASAAPLLDLRAGLPVMKVNELDGLHGLRRKVSELCEELLAYRRRLANWESDLIAFAEGLTAGGQPSGDGCGTDAPAGRNSAMTDGAGLPTPPEVVPGTEGPQQALERFGEALGRARELVAENPSKSDDPGPTEPSAPEGKAGAPGAPAKDPSQDGPDASPGPDKKRGPGAESAAGDKQRESADTETGTAATNRPGRGSNQSEPPPPAAAKARADSKRSDSSGPTSQAADPGPARLSQVNSMDLDPEVADKLRIMRRLNPHVGDVELLKQIEAEQQAATGKAGGKKPAWWSRK